MSAFEKFIHLLQLDMEKPANYGLLHICFLALTFIVAVLLVCFLRNAKDKTMRGVLLGVWLVLVILETYKQVSFSMEVEYGVAVWSYNWYSFPFQFCSSPLYALPFIVFLKDGWLRNSFITFFTGFSFFAGLAVMLYPNDVFSPDALINYQTMIHHGAQVAVGVFLVAHNRKHFKWRYLLGSIAIFLLFVAVAMVINELGHNYIVEHNVENDAINMFYISPHYDCTLPVLSEIYKKVPYPAFLAVYVLGFAGISTFFFSVEKGIVSLSSFLYNKVKGAKAA